MIHHDELIPIDLGFEGGRYEQTADGAAKFTICRPEVRDALGPCTVKELIRALDVARDDGDVGVVSSTGEGDEPLCSGGEQQKVERSP